MNDSIIILATCLTNNNDGYKKITIVIPSSYVTCSIYDGLAGWQYGGRERGKRRMEFYKCRFIFLSFIRRITLFMYLKKGPELLSPTYIIHTPIESDIL